MVFDLPIEFISMLHYIKMYDEVTVFKNNKAEVKWLILFSWISWGLFHEVNRSFVYFKKVPCMKNVVTLAVGLSNMMSII